MEDVGSRPNKKRRINDASTSNHADISATHGLQSGKLMALQRSRELLPIWPGKDAIVDAVKHSDSVVIIGEPGSGKTTQVPQYLLDAGLISPEGLIAVTQPRKVAATTIAARVAQERNAKLGSEVGYAIRFDDQSSPETRIKFYTDGMLLREMLNDSQLKRCDVVIVDEAHERTLRTDVLLANLKRIQKARSAEPNDKKEGKRKERWERRPLKIIVMSASLQAERFSRYLNNAPVLYVKGRQHPVRLFYSKTSQEDYLDSALRTFFQIHYEKEPGDVLIFLPGQEDIENLASTIKLYAAQRPMDSLDVAVRPLYAALPVAKQHEAFYKAPQNTRKCVLATNIAETSVTIPNIRFVIDCGLCNEKRYLAPEKGPGIERLSPTEISQSSAIQRAGRAGRDGPGKCFRLYTEQTYKQLLPAQIPEIKRCDLNFAILQQKSFGYDIEEMDLMDKPELNAVKASKTILKILGAVNQQFEITSVGKLMAKLPLEPHLARALLQSKENGCTKEVISIVSILSASSKVFYDLPNNEDREAAFQARSKFHHPSGDHLTLLNVFRAYDEISEGVKSSSSSNGQNGIGRGERKEWCRRQFLNERALAEATRIRDQLERACQQASIDPKQSCGDAHEPVLKSLFRGLVHHTALKQLDGSYKAGELPIKIHPSSVLCDKKPTGLMYEELVLTSFHYARCVSAFPPAWQMEWSDSLRKSL
ncbi:Probable ATP-dependent RNA helicase prh1 [Serendipita indica DSM 11827]|uniref:RNA helicase n=1 Tax=Serendipita indica (strain DSM 11827) TaxID=1109443 RepID=G4TVU9_SERID|nr:Probable ATP-dependent RNA helicase prh1 [Serendipita indica DSM 11827]CCA75442.1 probable ATP dependent RNA helicase [Serendipita indica DSM 11827]